MTVSPERLQAVGVKFELAKRRSLDRTVRTVGQVELDERRLVTTDPGFQTNVPGVFAVGDVRSGSMKRVASAVGEGSAAVQLVHKVLAE